MNCVNCNNKTKMFGKRYNKYCSLKCKREYENKISRKVFKEKKCRFCEKTFIPKNSRQVNCSFTCKVKWELKKISKKPKTKNCNVCKKEFQPYTSLDKFCSVKCRTKNEKNKRARNWKSVKNIIGKKNPNYKHGLTSNFTKQKYSNVGQRKYLRERKNKINKILNENGFLECERCKSTGVRLETHHIIFRSEKPNHEHIHNERNLITVCVPCHNFFHKKKNVRNYLIEERGLEELFGKGILR